jgi:hypothetical protein
MRAYTFPHLSAEVLLREMPSFDSRERTAMVAALDEAPRATAHAMALPTGATLEDRLRAALLYLCPARKTRFGAPPVATTT